MNKYEIKEIEGRNLMESFFKYKGITNYTFSLNKFSKIDATYISSKGKVVAVEIKTRDEKYMNYPTHLIEYSKYSYMKNNYGESIYVNFFTREYDNTVYMYVYNINNIKNEPIKMKLNKTTAEESNKVYKEVINIPKETAIIYYRFDGTWHKQG